MDINTIYTTIMNIALPIDDSYNVISVGDSYYGRTKEGYTVFLIRSNNPNSRSISQKTKHLFLGTNTMCDVTIDGNKQQSNVFDVMICFAGKQDEIISFIQLTDVYTLSNNETPISIQVFFESLKYLFLNSTKIPKSELQGLFGELFFMDYIQNEEFDIVKYWQSTDRMKFDFSLTESKKIEVKTTTLPNRIHKFRHEQLVSDIYDTWIVSIMLRKDDKGLSLYKLTERLKRKNPANLYFHTRITNILKNFTIDELEEIKYNEDYIKQNIGFFQTKDIPKFPIKEPEGVSNAEYDSDLSNLNSSEFDKIKKWIKNCWE